MMCASSLLRISASSFDPHLFVSLLLAPSYRRRRERQFTPYSFSTSPLRPAFDFRHITSMPSYYSRFLHPLKSHLFSATLMIVGLPILLSSTSASAAEHWWKGNTHTHSLWSDGDDYPEMIVDW